MSLLDKLTRRLAHRTTRDGVPVLATNGDADLIAAFAALGWTDPQPE